MYDEYFVLLYLYLQYAPYKSGSKRSLAGRAKELGLEKYALDMLENPRALNLNVAVQKGKKGRQFIILSITIYALY